MKKLYKILKPTVDFLCKKINKLQGKMSGLNSKNLDIYTEYIDSVIKEYAKTVIFVKYETAIKEEKYELAGKLLEQIKQAGLLQK